MSNGYHTAGGPTDQYWTGPGYIYVNGTSFGVTDSQIDYVGLYSQGFCHPELNDGLGSLCTDVCAYHTGNDQLDRAYTVGMGWEGGAAECGGFMTNAYDASTWANYNNCSRLSKN